MGTACVKLGSATMQRRLFFPSPASNCVKKAMLHAAGRVLRQEYTLAVTLTGREP